MFKLRVKNEGAAVPSGFKLRAVVNQGRGKIVDVKHVLRAPVGKTVVIVYSLPTLTWGPFRNIRNVAFKWSPPAGTRPLGYHLYRSTLSEVGYGKFNLGLIKNTCLVLNKQMLPPGYYAVVAVHGDGRLSEPSSPVRLPESLASQPNFEDVISIDPSFNENIECRAEMRTYRSLPEALAKVGRKSVFVIRKSRADIQSSIEQLKEYGRDLRIFYEDDLDFLRGQVELSFPDGLDSGGVADFYFVAKAFANSEPDIDLALVGQPTITFTGHRGKNEVASHREALSAEAKKRSLTPKSATARADQGAISLVWPRRSSDAYTGIRVFRVAALPRKEMDSLGEEIHDGKHSVGTFKCQPGNKVAEVGVDLSSGTTPPPGEPPKRKREIAPGTPSAPGSLTVTEGPSVGEPVAYYTDRDVRAELIYRYTIYAYDDDGNYSYPVQITASLHDSSYGLACSLGAEHAERSR